MRKASIVRNNAAVQAAVKEVAARLGNNGRILLRESGTEPLIRVMVEATTEGTCAACADEVVGVIFAEGLA